MNKSVLLLSALSICVLTALATGKELPAFSHSTQIVVVTTADWNSPQATLQRFERAQSGNEWKPVGRPFAVMVGKTGLGWGSGLIKVGGQYRNADDPVKKEGDGKAPAGVFRLSKAFGYAPQEEPGWKMPYVSLTPSIQCVDDTDSRFYNTLVDSTKISPDWGNHENEQMRRSDDLYRWGILVDHNANPPVAGKGSCIFMHVWRGPGQPTVGCTAMPQEQLESLLGWLDPARNPLLVQLPEAEYQKLRKHWRLPQLSRASSTNSSTMQDGAKAANGKP
jgi:L,D-peptidoglycan transpeptidase YkuD (ErfK/YbiS/YcfS/YnhG family)